MAKRKNLVVLLFMALLLMLPLVASADAPSMNGGGVLDSVVAKFQQAAANWSAVLGPAAQHLFLGLAVIGLIWSCGFLILERADIAAFFASFIRWMLFAGFFWWIVQHGTAIASAIVNSFASLGGSAAGTGTNLGPSTPLDLGFEILKKSGDAGHWYQVGDQICLVLVVMVILIAMAIISANMLITLCTSWLLIYAGQILLGFGAVKWTSDIAINYLRQVLGIGVTYMTMLLLVGVCNSVMTDYINSMNANTLTWQANAVVAMVAVTLAFLVHKVPPLVGSITGNHGGAHGSLGFGAALGAVAGAAAAVATGGAALAAGSAAGGALGPLMAAIRGGGEGGGASGGASGGGAPGGGLGGGDGASMADTIGAGNDSSDGGSPLASAMGDNSPSSRPSSRGNQFASFASRAGAIGRTASAMAHAGVHAMDQAVGGSGYQGQLSPGRSGGQVVSAGAPSASDDVAPTPSASMDPDGTPPPSPSPASVTPGSSMNDRVASFQARRNASATQVQAQEQAHIVEAPPEPPDMNAVAANDFDPASEIAAFVNPDQPPA